jgi:hypothetical protein
LASSVTISAQHILERDEVYGLVGHDALEFPA